jgi:uncharacterized protein
VTEPILPRAAALPLPAAPRRRQARDLDSAECTALLRHARWGILATSGERHPYAVPVAYGFDGEQIYIAMGDGTKTRNIERDPGLCLTIVDVAEIGACWRSVVILGAAEWVADLAGRLRGFEALRRHHGVALEYSARNVTRLAHARLLRIRIAQITGRAVGW